MKARRSNGNHSGRTGSLTLSSANPTPDGKVTLPDMPVERRRSDPDRDLDRLFSPAWLVSDKEFANVVRRVDALTKALNLDTIDPQARRVAVRPTALNADRRTIAEKELRYLLLSDDLTGLYNRRAFVAAATHQLKLASRNGESMLLWFCDVDNLKQINDRFGHRAGDLALARAGEALASTFRDSDILARLGGDEFAVLAPEASGRHESAILERLNQTLHESNPSAARYELTLSVGVARFDPERAVSLDELMAQADRDMYEQKRKRASPVRKA